MTLQSTFLTGLRDSQDFPAPFFKGDYLGF
jgi:hypothetical protein